MSQIDSQELQRWTDAVNSVVDRAREWAAKPGWQASVQKIALTEDGLGTYEVPVLTVKAAAGKIVLEPIARWSSPGDGRIDVYSWPSLNRLMLVRKGADWVLLTESGVPWPQTWGEGTFIGLAASLNAAA